MNLRPPRFLAGTCEILGRGRPPPGGDRTAPGAVQRRLWAFETAAQLLSIMKPRMNAEEAFQEVAAKAEELIDWSHGGRQTRLETMPYKEYLATPTANVASFFLKPSPYSDDSWSMRRWRLNPPNSR